jgi:hypothetical protein
MHSSGMTRPVCGLPIECRAAAAGSVIVIGRCSNPLAAALNGAGPAMSCDTVRAEGEPLHREVGQDQRFVAVAALQSARCARDEGGRRLPRKAARAMSAAI